MDPEAKHKNIRIIKTINDYIIEETISAGCWCPMNFPHISELPMSFPWNFPVEHLHVFTRRRLARRAVACRGAVVHQPLPGQVRHVPTQRLQHRVLLDGGHQKLRLAVDRIVEIPFKKRVDIVIS